jgi:hypothetical protein
LILSYLLVDDKDAMHNEFIESLGADFWVPEAGWSQEMETFPDLDTIVYGGAKTFLDKSFY